MQAAALLFLIAAATAVPFDPQGDFWDYSDDFNYEGSDPYAGDGPNVPQFGWFKGDNYDFGANGPIRPDIGADGDDSYFTRETAGYSGFVQDHLANAAAFLYDQGSDTFDFQEWYNGELEDFKSDQEDINYYNSYDKIQDMDDFKDQLDQIAYEFQEAQNNDYADFVSDTVNDVWGETIDQSQDVIAQLREAGYELNEYEHQAAELYSELLELGCGSTTSGDSYLSGDYQDSEDYHQTMLALIDPNESDYDLATEHRTSDDPTVTYYGEPQDSRSQCQLSQIFWEYIEINDELAGAGYYAGSGGHLTTARRHDLEDQQNELVRAFNKIRRQWRTLRKQLQDAENNSDHERKEIAELNKILANLLTVDDSYSGPLGGVAVYDGAKAARPRKLDGSWNPYATVDFNYNNLYNNYQPPPYYPTLV
jgi:hypothetical protein